MHMRSAPAAILLQFMSGRKMTMRPSALLCACAQPQRKSPQQAIGLATHHIKCCEIQSRTQRQDAWIIDTVWQTADV